MQTASIALSCWLALAAAALGADQPTPAGEPIIAAGQEQLAARMLGRGEAVTDDCRLIGGAIEYAVIVGTYRCGDQEVRIELGHPSRMPTAAVQTERFAIAARSGTAPPALIEAVAARVRSQESAFAWTLLVETPSPIPEAAVAQSPPQSPAGDWRAWVLGVAGLLTVLALAGRWIGAGGRWSRLRRDPIGQLAALLRSETFWLLAVFALSAALRCWMSVVNWSGGNHVEVAELIRSNGWRPPPPSACMQCAHPKLYHYLLAAALELAGGSDTIAARVGRLANFVAGTVLLGLLWSYSKRLGHSVAVRIAGIAFMSLNAAFVLAFSWGQNDAFCILFSSLTIYCLLRFGERQAWGFAVAAVAAAVLAALSKATGWAIFGAGALILLVNLVVAQAGQRRRWARGAAIFVLGFFLVVPWVNPYRDNLAQRGTPFVNDAFDVPLMRMEVPRPPVTWVVEDFFTFRIFALLSEPYIDFDSRPAHRTSLWSQLHGWSYFLQFAPLWGERWERPLMIGRICLALGLLPFAALVLGVWTAVRRAVGGLIESGWRWLAENTAWYHLVYVATVMMAMVALVTRYHRWVLLFTWMNPTYLLPAVVSFYALFLSGLEILWRRWPRLVIGWMAALVLASLIDVAALLYQLT